MASVLALAQVWLWDKFVGAVTEEDDGRVTFEYDEAFRRSGLEISPRKLPLQLRGPVTFPDLNRVEAFAGLPGVLADSLPDRFGNAIIKAYFENRGQPESAMSPVQKLLYIGKRGMGALEFRPAIRGGATAHERQSLEVADLVEQARRLIEGKTDVAVAEIMRIGSSAGGARPKAVILWNRDKGEVRSSFAPPKPGDEHWIIKFDGVGLIDAPNPKPQPYNRIEYVYAMMARDAGIEMEETHLLTERNYAHFMVKRFDRVGAAKLHLHSLGGLDHADYNAPGTYSYEQFLRIILELQLGYPALEQAYRRICFNIMAVNQDDHVKNIAFLMDDAGKWRLAPAYDLTYARGQGYTRQHQMSLGGKRDGFTSRDLIDLGKKFGIKQDGEPVIEKIRAALKNWDRLARKWKVPAKNIATIKSQFRLT
ncbi:MAG: type II toxin-antitoxin system HipA family toxin [Burkholderiales bacterium]|nr:type II toxin-antitoxin system HipA family toxin [Burkholderiales bacterium]